MRVRLLDHDPGRSGLPRGAEGAKQASGMLRAAFPDLRATVFGTVADGDLVAVRGEVSGTVRGDLMGRAPTGNAVS